MPPTPFISIIIPAYKALLYIEKCVSSCLNQTIRNIEILVVDDASPDATRSAILALAARDDRIKPILLDRNGGVCNARNCALDAAQGEWIAVLDSDDWMAPDRLERMATAARDTQTDIIIDDQYFIREGEAEPCARLFVDEPHGVSLLDPSHFVLRDTPEYMGYGLAKPLFRRAFLDAHHIRYRLGTERFEDFLFLIECLARGAKAALLNAPLYYYLLRKGSLTGMDQIRTMDGLMRQNQLARAAAQDAGADQLDAALAQRERLIEQGQRYYKVIVPLKKREASSAALALAQDPAITPYIARKFAVRLWHRMSAHDPLALALLPGAKLTR